MPEPVAASPNNPAPLSGDEQELLALWAWLAPNDRAALLQIARTIAAQVASPSVM